ncbi:MAG TPA: hypothetical protein VLT92_14625 [Burkholderiales bacterium]|nr:hypothetical protein [Burkholderiales bacterium]
MKSDRHASADLKILNKNNWMQYKPYPGIFALMIIGADRRSPAVMPFRVVVLVRQVWGRT